MSRKKRIYFVFLVYVIACFSYAQEPPLVTIFYQESDVIFPNPERGFYLYTLLPYLSPSSLSGLREKGETLIFGKINANAFRTKDFSQDFLDRIQKGFDIARAAGVKVNVRVSYSDDIGQPDASKEQIFRHIDQLMPLLEKNADVICLMEAGFIGAWGEWHSSTNGLDTPENRRAILFKLLSALPKERMVVVRTPHFKREIYSDSVITSDRAFDGSNLARTGFHNDCFLSSADDFGTYVERSRSAEIEYIGNETRYTPFGGESCALSPYSASANAIYEMSQLHCTYLNDSYHSEVLKRWQNEGCLDEIKRRLGYRFVLRKVEISEKIRPGGVLAFNFIIENVGFAALFNPRPAFLVMRNNQTGREDTARISVEPRYWLPYTLHKVNRQFRVPYHLPEGSYSLLLRFPDPKPTLASDPRYAIRLANLDIWEEKSGSNLIKSDFIIDANVPGNFDPYDSLFHEIASPTYVLNENRTPPHGFVWLKAFPNPFNSKIRIQVALSHFTDARLSIYNIKGELIRVLLEGTQPAGSNWVDWDGKDQKGQQVAMGIYLLNLLTSGSSTKMKISYLK